MERTTSFAMLCLWLLVPSVASSSEPASNGRSNLPLSIADLPAGAGDDAPGRLPTLAARRRIGTNGRSFEEAGVVQPELRITPQVAATRAPQDDDGLQGNRQVALTPFPNLHMQSGPLSPDQLPWHAPTVSSRAPTWVQSLEYESSMSASDANGLGNGGLGWYNSLEAAFPFWRERSVGLQAGITFEPTTFPQVLSQATVGFFRRAMWPEEVEWRTRLWNRASWGTAVDSVWDTEHRSWLGQVRTQLGYSLAPNREMGLWLALPVNDDRAPVGSALPVLVDLTTLGCVYYRHAFANEMDVTGLAGVSEYPGEFFAGFYLAKRFSHQASWTLSAMNNFGEEGGYAIRAGLRFDFWPTSIATISGNPENRYRPFLRVADHIQMQFRMRSLVPLE